MAIVQPRIGILLGAFAIGCGGGDEPPDGEPQDCAPGTWLHDGVCTAAGLPADMPCPPGEWPREGECIPAGVQPDGCGAGFVHDGDRGCEPILPSSPCPPGLMAVPGERLCREVAPCAPGRWGDIPVEPDTQYVDASYTGMDSDGSALKPWTTIQAGVDAAASGAIVAIAAGSYVEDVTVNTPVRLWGVCPALVELRGMGTEFATVQVFYARATELRNLAIRGEPRAVVASGALDVLIERVWVHDGAYHGVVVQDDYGPTSLMLRASLVERNQQIGVVAWGSLATVEASVIRDTQPDAQGQGGRGVTVQRDALTGASATLLLHGSLIEQSHNLGVFVAGSEATVEASVVRDTQPDALVLGGRGVSAQPDADAGVPSTLVLRTSLVEQSIELGVYVEASQATVDASVIRGTQPNAEGLMGRGISAQGEPITGAPSTLLLRNSLVEESHEVGVNVSGSNATVEATAVRDTLPDARGFGGRGLNAQAHPAIAAPSTFVLRNSLVERSYEVGVSVYGSNATVEASVIRDTQPNGLGLFGRGVTAQADLITASPSTLLLRTSLVEQTHDAGVAVVGADATIDSCLVRDTASDMQGYFGDGVLVLSELAPASTNLLATRIEHSVRASVAVFGAHAAVGGSAFTCQAFDFDRESYEGTPATFEDLGGDLCGCPQATEPCKAVSTGLEAPAPLESLPE